MTEPNNSFDEATLLGTISNYYQIGTISDSTDEDWYEFTLAQSGGIDDIIDTFSYGGNLTLALYDSEQNQLYETTEVTLRDTISLDNLPAGTYYYQVTGTAGSSYDFSVVAEGYKEDAYEPNETVEQAYNLGLVDFFSDYAALESSNEDWYQFELGQTGGTEDRVYAYFYEDIIYDDYSDDGYTYNSYSPVGYLNLALYDEEQNLISDSIGTEYGDTISLEGLTAGTYFLQISGFASEYEFGIYADGSIYYEDDYEPNETIDEAYNIGLGYDYYGFASIREGSEDWYQFEIGQDGGTYDRVYSYASDGNVDLALYDSEQNLISDSVGTTFDDTISLEGLTAGTYYLQVTGESSYYEFNINADGYVEYDDYYEPNDSIDTASYLDYVEYFSDTVYAASGNPDWYQFELGQTGGTSDRIRTYVYGDVVDFGLDIALYDGEQNLIGEYNSSPFFSDSDYENSGISLEGLDAGTYYFEVSGGYGSDYDLTIAADSGVEYEDEYEPNETIDTAYNLGLVEDFDSDYISLALGTQDWYQFEIGQTSDLLIETGYRDLALYDEAQNLIVEYPPISILNDGEYENNIINLEGVDAGTYFLKVSGQYGGDYDLYTLEISTYNSEQYDDPEQYNDNDYYEPNDSLDEAYDLGLVDYFYDWVSLPPGSEDWYQFEIGQTGGTYDEVYSYSYGLDGVDLALYDEEQNLIRESGVIDYYDDYYYDDYYYYYDDYYSQISLEGLDAGTYYLGVSGGDGSDYEFGIYADGYVYYDDYYDPNESIDEAYDLGLVSYFYDYASLERSPQDWYQFELGQTGGTYDEIYTYGYDLNVALYDEEQNLITESYVGDEYYSSVSLEGLDAGTYYFEVSGDNGSYYDFGIYADGYIEYEDYYEPNDSLDEAYDLGYVYYHYDYATVNPEQPDWYKFTLDYPGGAYDYINTYFSDAEGDIDIALYDAEQNLIDSSVGVSDSEYISLAGLASGDYYLEVFRSDTGGSSEYNLEIYAEGDYYYDYYDPYYYDPYYYDYYDPYYYDPYYYDSYEPNDSASEAAILGSIAIEHGGYFYSSYAGIDFSGDEDWYSFTLDNTGGFYDQISAYFSSFDGNVDLALYDADLNEITSSQGLGDEEYISLEGFNPGDYYLQVYGADGDYNPYYSLEISTSESYYSNDINEPNEDFASATNIGLVYSHYDYGSIEPANDQDWYRFEIAQAGGVWDEIALWYDDFAGDVGITLYDAEQNLIDESVGTSGYEFLSLDGLAAGEYYLQVNGVGQGTNPYYDFSIYAYGDDYYYEDEFYYQEDIYEPNDTASEASDLGWAYCYYGYGIMEAGTTEDWYYFYTDAIGGGADGINVSFDEGVNIDITLYDENLNEIGSSNGDADWEFISLEDVTAGNYYVQVSGIDNETDAHYDFFINAYGANDYFIEEENDDFGDYNEPNNTSDTATRLGPIDYYYEYGLSLGEIRDRDWYRFSLAQDGGTYDGATVYFYNGEGNVDLALYSVDDPSNPIAVSESENDYEEVSFAGLPEGQYFLEVYGAGGGTNPYYDLEIYADGYVYEDDIYDDYTYEELVSYSDFNEPNNELDVATNLGTSDFYYTSGSISPEGDYDWYQFDLRQDGGFDDFIDVYFDGIAGDIDIALYDADGNYLDSSAGTSDYEYIDLEGYSAGTYYLEVYNYSGTSNSWYDVSIFAYGEADYTDPYYYEEYFYDDYYEDYDPIYDYDYIYDDFYIDDYFYGEDFYDDNYNDYIANAPDDRFEENDERTTAALLNLDAQSEWGDLIINMADADWYRFNLSGEGKPGDEVSIDFLHADGDLDMVLHDAEGNWIDGSYSVQDGETIDLEGLPAGDYYLNVYGYAGASNDYSLGVTARGGDALEENDTFADARELIVTDTRSSWTELSIESGDDDWYNFTLPNLPTAGDEISIEFDHELGDLDIALYDSRNRIIAASTGTGNTETISLEGLGLNTESVYYLEVYGYAGASNPEYDLEIEVFPEADAGSTSDRFEDNDASSAATLLDFPSGDKTWSDLTIEPEDADWYRFNLPQEGAEDNQVRIDFAHDVGDLDLALYSVDDPDYALYYSAGTDDSETISLNSLPAGDYYVEVYGFAGAINDDYSLSINVAPEEVQGDGYEDNNLFEEAADITPKIGEYLEGLNITAGDTDWYEFVLTQTGQGDHGIVLDFAHLEGDLDVELYNANNEYLQGSYGIEDGEFISLEGVEPGNYFVKVYGYAGATNDYNLLLDAPGLTGESDREDDYEDNDTRDTAYELGLLEGNDPERNSFENLAIASNNPDWFEFTISQTGSDEHHVSIDFNHDAGDLDLALYDAQGNLLDISDSLDNGETITLYDRPAGRYYVEVIGWDGASNSSYDLTFDTPEDIPSSFRDDESEPNDTFDTATVITEKLGQSIEDLIIVEDNQDWYTFELPGDAQPGDYVQIDFNGNAADLDLELYDSTGLLLRDSAGVSDTENISLDGLSAGEYTVKVFNYEYQFLDEPDYEPFGDAVAEYSLEVQATPPNASQNIAGDIYEPNNDLATAFDLRTIDGTFSTEVPLSIHEARNADWFKFQSATDGLVSVAVDFEHDLGDLDLTVYQQNEDGSRTVVSSSETTDDTEMVIIPEAVAGEDYYVEVYGYASATNPEYYLTVDTPVIAEVVEEEDKPEELEDDGIDDWTVMVYINADNNLDFAGMDDINEMEAVMDLPDNVNVVVQIDRSDEYSDDWTDTRRGAITPDNNPYEVTSELESIGEVNMGDAESLTEFINWSKANYTAENYSVVIWDHGGGLDGISWDETDSYDYLTVDDVTQAISAADLGESLGMVGFDACLMALAEVGYDLSGLTDVVVASQQLEPGDGWDYTGWLEQIADTNGYIDPEDLAQAVVDSYDEFYDGTYTQSAVKASEYEGLKAEVDNFARTVLNNATQTDWDGIVAARNAATANDWQLPTERDLKSFMQNVANNDAIAPEIQNAATEVIAQIDNAVIGQVDGLGYGGIGIYLPAADSYVRGDYNETQFSFLADNAWDDFVFGLANSESGDVVYADPTETSNSTDGIQNANLVDSPSSPFQLGELNIDYTLEDLSIDGEQDTDWFEFNLPVDGTAEASVGINFTHESGDLTLELFRKEDAQNAIATSETDTDNESLSLDGLTAGDYLIKVSGQVNPEYQLVLDAPEFTEIPDDSQEATEPGDETNDTFAKATELGAIERNDEFFLTGLTMDADDASESSVAITEETNARDIPAGGDWFVFNAIRNTALSPNAVTLLSEESGNLDLHLFDAAGNLIGSAADAESNTEAVSFGEQSGEIYAYVTGETNAGYELNIARREFDINGDGVADTKDMLLTFLASSSFADSDIEGFITQFDLTPAGSERTTVAEIKDYVATALNNILDVDGDGNADSKDLLLNFIANSSFSDSDIEGFIQQFGLITENSERDNIEAIREFISDFQPEPSESISTPPQIDLSSSLYGTDDADVLTGTVQDDTLIGGAGNDELAGKAGNDTFYGGTDNDTLIGGAGADVFNLGLNSGNDLIEDFDTADTIVLDPRLGFSNFEELSLAISPLDSGSELVFNTDNKLTINHTEELTADNFDFL